MESSSKKKIIKRWTEEEDTYIKSNYLRADVSKMAKTLGRTEQSVRGRIYSLNLSVRCDDDGLILSDFCRHTQISKKQVSKWIKKYNLPVKKIYQYKKIYPADFWKWAKEHPHLIVWRDFPDYGIGLEPTWVKELRKDHRYKTKQFRHWTQEEDERLRIMLQRDAYTYADLSKALNRSQSAIKRRIYEKKLSSTPLRATKKSFYWTEEEIDLASDLYRKGFSLAYISEKVGRSEQAIITKLNNLKKEGSV